MSIEKLNIEVVLAAGTTNEVSTVTLDVYDEARKLAKKFETPVTVTTFVNDIWGTRTNRRVFQHDRLMIQLMDQVEDLGLQTSTVQAIKSGGIFDILTLRSSARQLNVLLDTEQIEEVRSALERIGYPLLEPAV